MSWNSSSDPDHRRTLFVLFPRTVKDREEIKKLHPGIEAVRFKNRSYRWCHMIFKTEKLAKQAAKELHKKKLKHGRLIVSETKAKQKKDVEQKAKSLFVTNIPKDATKDDIKSAFKTCRRVCIKAVKKNKKKFKAILTMQSFAEAQALFADKESHRINGVPVTVRFPNRVMDIIQNAKNTPKTVKVIGRKELEGVETVNTSRNNIKNGSGVETGCDTSINKVEENIEKNSHVMQNYQVHIGKPSSSNAGKQKVQKVEDDAEDSEEDDDDMEGSQGQESD